MKSRLTAMELVPDVEITVVSSAYPGPFVINVKDSKMMLDRKVKKK